jgi:formyltetrahydrofolate hydrolase
VGSNQAFDKGVKLIGATSHFVTEELDEGPIIEQLVDRVSHRDVLSDFCAKSQVRALPPTSLDHSLSWLLPTPVLLHLRLLVFTRFLLRAVPGLRSPPPGACNDQRSWQECVKQHDWW